MRAYCYTFFTVVLILVNSFMQPAVAQLGFDLKIDKPKPYEERVLRSEKTSDKPLPAQKKFFQNLTTHFNYFYNANNKLNEVIDGAKTGFKDDYTVLLPFYNYTLDATSRSTTELDSVIYKAQTGIVMHDLRNDWIDNLYLLWGAAWFFEKKFDSAALMFQFINYSFAEKEKDGYYRYIGSRMDGNNALSISTEENRRFPKNLVTPPSRNIAFIWQARTMIEAGDLSSAGSLIATLKNDPLFPERLRDDLEELQAYWYYKQNVWDSSAVHLLNALGQAKTKQEKARWEYLAAQMLEKSGRPEEAHKWFAKSIGHTTDPVMDVYARLNMVRIRKDTTNNYIDQNIAELLKMAKRDKYVDYRDVIYFMAAQMEMERNNFGAAQELLLKSTKYNNDNLASRTKSYLLIADLSFDQKKYLQAASFYDSVQTRDLEEPALSRVQSRKDLLVKLVAYSATIQREDSLQRIAGMPEEERDALINKLVKQLRKQQGLDDAPGATSGSALPTGTPNDFFSTPQPKGEWYFYNTTLKTQGQQKFKQVWGNRPNVDNWRRFADVNQQLIAKSPNNTRGNDKATDVNLPLDNTPSLNALLNNLPLTETKLETSNDSLRNALWSLGTLYMNEVEDYASAIETFEKIRTRFPAYQNMSEVLFNLYYAYKKSGNEAKAEEIKKLLLARYPVSKFASILSTGKDPAATNNQSGESTTAYEKVYDLFIEGKFEEAEAKKKIADSMYKTNYWQPQLLYIEAVYQIRQRQDSLAKNTLQTLIGQNQNTPLAIKAQNLLDVLGRRQQIEAELTALQIERPPDDVVQQPVTQNPPPVVKKDPVIVSAPPPVKKDTVVAQPNNTVVTKPPPVKAGADTTVKKPVTPPQNAIGYRLDTASKHFVVIILDKVDPVFTNEVKTAFFRYSRDKFYNQTYNFNLQDLDADRKLLLIGDFSKASEAITYLQSARRSAANEIIPWLKADKYSFSIISEANLQILLQRKDLPQYKQFLDQNLPGKL